MTLAIPPVIDPKRIASRKSRLLPQLTESRQNIAITFGMEKTSRLFLLVLTRRLVTFV